MATMKILLKCPDADPGKEASSPPRIIRGRRVNGSTLEKDIIVGSGVNCLPGGNNSHGTS